MIRVGIAAVLLAAGCSSSTTGTGSTYEPPAPTTHAVVYKLGGTADGADVTYEADTGGTRQEQDVAVPLTSDGQPGFRFEADSGAFLYISAQNNGDGTITCSIEVDGVEISHNASSGEFAIVTCKGTA